MTATGHVYLVGAGPGDPGLITVRGQRLLAEADVVLYDRLAPAALLAGCRDSAELIHVGKSPHGPSVSQERTIELMIEHARAGRRVVRLKGGDPMVFGRGGEEAEALVEAGIAFDVVPGITAAIAAAAYAGIPVTHRDYAGSFALATGHEAPDKAPGEASVGWAQLARAGGTLAVYMGVGRLGGLCETLLANGRGADEPAAVIERGTTPQQRVIAAPLGKLAAAAEAAGVRPPAMILVGSVVALREKLAWFDRRPLRGRRILVTRPAASAGELLARLEDLGAEAICTPTIAIAPPAEPGELHKAAGQLDECDWLVLTSANGAGALFEALARTGRDARALAGVSVCAIGPATASALAEAGIVADLVPPTYTTAAVVDALSAVAPTGSRVLCLRSARASGEMIDALGQAGLVARQIDAYDTVADEAGCRAAGQQLAAGGVDWVTFTSRSTFQCLAAAIGPEAIAASGARLASIGPVTSEALREAGLAPAVEAKTHTAEGLADAILQASESP